MSSLKWFICAVVKYSSIFFSCSYFFVNNQYDDTIFWWQSKANGSALIDFTQSDAVEWFNQRLMQLVALMGIDSFRFDAGESNWVLWVSLFDFTTLPNTKNEILLPFLPHLEGVRRHLWQSAPSDSIDYVIRENGQFVWQNGRSANRVSKPRIRHFRAHVRHGFDVVVGQWPTESHYQIAAFKHGGISICAAWHDRWQWP